MSTLIIILIVCLCVGLLIYAINRYLPMDQGFKNILNFIVIIVLILWILNKTGILTL